MKNSFVTNGPIVCDMFVCETPADTAHLDVFCHMIGVIAVWLNQYR